MNPKRMVLVLAGNSALETVRLTRGPDQTLADAQFAVFDFGRQVKAGFLQ
jgi:hypothetical protein